MREEKINPADLCLGKIAEILKLEKIDLQLAAKTELGDGLIIILGPITDDGPARSLAFLHSVFNTQSQILLEKSFPTAVVSLGKWRHQYLGKNNYHAWQFRETEKKILERVKEVRVTDFGLNFFGETKGHQAVLHLYPDEDFGFTHIYTQDSKKSFNFDVKREVAQLRDYCFFSLN